VEAPGGLFHHQTLMSPNQTSPVHMSKPRSRRSHLQRQSHFLAGNLNGHGSTFLSNAEPKEFCNKLVAVLHGFSESKLQRRGLSTRIKLFSPASMFS
jgi:hypothetical protein